MIGACLTPPIVGLFPSRSPRGTAPAPGSTNPLILRHEIADRTVFPLNRRPRIRNRETIPAADVRVPLAHAVINIQPMVCLVVHRQGRTRPGSDQLECQV